MNHSKVDWVLFEQYQRLDAKPRQAAFQIPPWAGRYQRVSGS